MDMDGIKESIRLACNAGDMNSLQNLLALHSQAISSINWFSNDLEGATPLDWVSTKVNPNLISILLESGCPPNIRNNRTGLAVLHVRTKMGCLDSVIQLLSYMADPNLETEGTLDSPLHFAAKSNNPNCLHIIKALALFNANLDAKNGSGETPRHLISENPSIWAPEGLIVLDRLGALRCPESYLCAEGCEFVPHDPKYRPVSHLSPPVSVIKEKIFAMRQSETHILDNFRVLGECKVLCLDGGGIRGLVLTQILLVLEQKLGRPIREIFNCISGTSTGGILALGLAVKKSVLECQSMYFQLKDKVFKGGKPYSVRILEEFYQQMFGQTAKMNTIDGMRVMVMATQVNVFPAELHIFRNYDPPSPPTYQETEEDEYIWRVAKVTSAAPFYFKMEHHSLVDGGFVSNNPTLDVLAELSQLQQVARKTGSENSSDFKKLVPACIVSLGTGIFTRELNAMMMDFGVKTNWLDTLVSFGCANELKELILEQATASNGAIVNRAEAWCSSIGTNYLRLNPPLTDVITLDEIDNVILLDIMFKARVYMQSLNIPSVIIDLLRNV